ncbi:MAG: hypothetical protein L0G41_02410 [Psychrobacter sp.]|nr:hypothetical protein [Psychrobacter sp.]
MSFLNPVSEPVLRFSSTDTDAPQINYAARVAGDVKTVLKACLVTGYGAKPSAGWSIANDVDHVAEFVSPSAAMSDYRLGIDDTSTSSTTWYYQYQDARIDPRYNVPTKSLGNVDKAHIDNGWRLVVSSRGFILIEILQHNVVKKPSVRITYFSPVKSMLSAVETHNMMFFNFGHDGQIDRSSRLHTSTYPYCKLNDYTAPEIFGTLLLVDDYDRDISVVDVTTQLFVKNASVSAIIAKVPGLLAQTISQTDDIYRLRDIKIDGRDYLSVCTGYSYPTAQYVTPRARNFLIPTDYWEY